MVRAALALAWAGTALGQPMPANVSLADVRTDEAARDKRERFSELIRALNIRAGSHVADMGSGYGYCAVRLAPVVGSGGRVLAQEIDQPLVTKLRARVSIENLANVRVVLGTPADPRLPEASLDAVLISDVYHEVANPVPWLRRIAASLKPGGRVVIVDYLKPENRARNRAGQAKEHNVAPDLVEADLVAAGFAVVDRMDPYAPGYDDIPTYFLAAVYRDTSNSRAR